MSKASQVFTCIFTNTPPQGGAYNVNTLPSQERAMFNAVSDAHGAIVAASGDQPLLLSMCYAKAAEFQAFLSGVSLAPPFMAIMGIFPGGEKKYYLTKQPAQAKQYIEAMLSGQFGGTGLPTNAGDGDGGWGQGDGGLLCKLVPPLCALGFLPWLALSVFTTYKAAESRSTGGKAMWGVPAFLFWQGFLARGGVKQIQWWGKQVGIGKIGELKVGSKRWYEILDDFERSSKKGSFIPNLRYDRVGRDEDVPAGVFYHSGETNKIFHAFLLGYNIGEYYARD